jgi:hypothetical protein
VAADALVEVQHHRDLRADFHMHSSELAVAAFSEMPQGRALIPLDERCPKYQFLV